MMISLRAITQADMPFLQSVYASTRQEELAVTGWQPAQINAFLANQFALQHQYYNEHYTGARYNVILVDGTPAGRLYIVDWEATIRIQDFR
jgi:hypothetical protein